MQARLLLVLTCIIAVTSLIQVRFPEGGEVVPDQYIITFVDGVDQKQIDSHLGFIRSVWNKVQLFNEIHIGGFNGYTARLTPTALAALSSSPLIASIEADTMVYPIACNTQSVATGLYGIDRIDGTLNGNYRHDPTSGNNIDVYVIDSGVLGSHTDFGGRVLVGQSFAGLPAANTDCMGHGTHVAGTIAGSTYGVAKGATIIPLRVFSCSGSTQTSTIIEAVQYAVTSMQSRGRKSVANLSIGGGGRNIAMEDAINNAVTAGLVVVAAAGNDNLDACQVAITGPSSLGITVGAVDRNNRRASFSNYGRCVTVMAPGVDTLSAWFTSNSASATISGTSMASPHVAGVAAALLSKNNNWTPAQVKTAIVNNAASGVNNNCGLFGMFTECGRTTTKLVRNQCS